MSIQVGDDLSGAKLLFDFNYTNLHLSDFSAGNTTIFKSDDEHYLQASKPTPYYLLISLRDGDVNTSIASISGSGIGERITLNNRIVELSNTFGTVTEIDDELPCAEAISESHHNKVYGYCESLCKVEVLSKEESLRLIPKIVTLTQQEYDDLDNPDEDTYYFIEEE